MKILSNEQIIWNFLHKCRNGISVNELARQTEVSKPTAVKITDKFKKSGDLTKPEFVRGKKSLLILTKFTLRDNFQTVKKLEMKLKKD